MDRPSAYHLGFVPVRHCERGRRSQLNADKGLSTVDFSGGVGDAGAAQGSDTEDPNPSSSESSNDDSGSSTDSDYRLNNANEDQAGGAG